MRKPSLILTPGDPAGIGPEVTWKAICADFKKIRGKLLCIGARAPFEKLGAPIVEARLDSLVPPTLKTPYIWLLPCPNQAPTGRLLEGFQVGWSIETATQLVFQGTGAALITGPISKERLQKGGYPFPGHTEFLAQLCHTHRQTQSSASLSPTPEVTMMLANETLRVSLVTTHLSLQNVPQALHREGIRRAILHTAEGLSRFWGISNPKIAVTALNPHGGEQGIFGREEIDLILPEIKSLQSQSKNRFQVFGPFPADTFFAKHVLTPKNERYDAVVCMYHDQGLIPVKLLDFHKTVNVTLGLPIIRTSVDHGVGFDIAGKGVADPSSLRAAIRLATKMTMRHEKK